MSKKLNNFQQLEAQELEQLNFNHLKVKRSVDSSIGSIKLVSEVVELFLSHLGQSVVYLLSPDDLGHDSEQKHKNQ